MRTDALNIAFIMDPIADLDIHHDTTFSIMEGALQRGHKLFYLNIQDLYAIGKEPRSFARPAVVRYKQGDHYELGKGQDRPFKDFDLIFMRKDPPFNMEYIYTTYILSMAPPTTVVINHPRGLREANEKMYVHNFPEIIPETCVARSRERLLAFLQEVGGRMVIKPLDLMGGQSVLIIDQRDLNKVALLDMMLEQGRRTVMAQRYLPQARKGDKRVLMIGGEPVGAVLRVPTTGDHRGNLCVGANPVKTELTDSERALCEAMKPRLLADGIYFAGIDIIDSKLIEVNVTSPTGIQEVNRLDGIRLEEDLLDYCEELWRIAN